jgi:hypothetical protein
MYGSAVTAATTTLNVLALFQISLIAITTAAPMAPRSNQTVLARKIRAIIAMIPHVVLSAR